MARKPSLGGLLLAGAAAYGLYKVSKMSAGERSDLVNKGKKFVNDNLGGLKNKFDEAVSSAGARAENHVNGAGYER